jgi:hypothetical protein
MKIKTLRATAVSLALFVSLTFAMDGMSDAMKKSETSRQPTQTHASGLKARVTLPDGTNRTVTLDGFGCSAAICSRVFVQAKAFDGSTAKVWIDELAAIKDITPNSALFVMKDGTQQRLSLIPDFRVLYLAGGRTRPGKLDLSTIQSLQMLASAK